MQRVFQRFVDDLEQSHDIEVLRRTMKSATSAFDLSVFAYLTLPTNTRDKPTLISTYPTGWTDHYLNSHYQAVDTVVARALARQEPFRWGLEFGPNQMTPRQRQVFDEAAQFGIRCGYTIPIHDRRGRIAAMTFATDRNRRAFDRNIARHDDVLQLLTSYFHAHVRRKLSTPRAVIGVSLTPREYECLVWTAEGKSAWEIGRILGPRLIKSTIR